MATRSWTRRLRAVAVAALGFFAVIALEAASAADWLSDTTTSRTPSTSVAELISHLKPEHSKKSPTFLLETRRTAYLLIETTGNYRHVAAIHRIGPEEDFLPFKPRHGSSGEIMGYTETNEYISHLGRTLLPAIEDRPNAAIMLQVHHYRFGDKGVAYAYTPLKRVTQGYGRNMQLLEWEREKAFDNQEGYHRTGSFIRNAAQGGKALAETERLRQLAGQKLRQERARLHGVALERMAEELNRANAARLVYKTPLYWVDFPSGDQLKAIFDGNFTEQTLDRTMVKNLFLAYVATASSTCRNLLPDRVVEFTLTSVTTTRNGFGQVKDLQTSESRILVDPKLADKFEQYQREGSSLSDMAGLFYQLAKTKTPADVLAATRTGVFGKYINPILDVQRLMLGAGCDSAVIRQFSENISRAALNRPSLQAAPQPIAGAIEASDKEFVTGVFSTIAAACHDDEAYERRPMPFCACVDREMRSAVPASDYRRFAGDYSAFVKEVLQADRRGNVPSGHPYWSVQKCKL